MKNKKKITVITLSILLVSVLSIVTYNLSFNREVIVSDHTAKSSKDKTLAVLLETTFNSGQYKESSSNTWPKGYALNKRLSKCENGSTLEYDEENNKILVNVNKTDRCYVYFDLNPDIKIAINHPSTTPGLKANFSCDGINATYSDKYNRIEISALEKNKPTCTINYEQRTDKTYLNNYIISLSGTEQGNGSLVHEKIDKSTFTDLHNLEKANYINLTNDATYAWTWNATDKSWISSNKGDSAKTTTSTIIFNPNANGMYNICYKQSSEINYDYGTIFKNNSELLSLKGREFTEYECLYLGNLTTSDQIKVTYHKDGSGNVGDDEVSFYLQTGTYNENITLTDYRYEGQNPNNYIWFNNELWRIIGVFDSKTHGQSGENLVKIIRSEPIGGIVRTLSLTGKWSDSSLNSLLNGPYYNSEDGTNSGYCYGYCPNSGDKIQVDCNYNVIGIKEKYHSMIKNVNWYIDSSYSSTVDDAYNFERTTETFKGNIGLMYPSDYGYSVLSDNCTRTTRLNLYGTSSCAGKSWLNGKGNEWLITGSGFAHYISIYGIGDDYGPRAKNVRPVLYLNSNVYKIDGDGSVNNPYIIGVDGV